MVFGKRPFFLDQFTDNAACLLARVTLDAVCASLLGAPYEPRSWKQSALHVDVPSLCNSFHLQMVLSRLLMTFFAHTSCIAAYVGYGRLDAFLFPALSRYLYFLQVPPLLP